MDYQSYITGKCLKNTINNYCSKATVTIMNIDNLNQSNIIFDVILTNDKNFIYTGNNIQSKVIYIDYLQKTSKLIKQLRGNDIHIPLETSLTLDVNTSSTEMLISNFQNKNILIVDDNITNVKIMKRKLNKLNYKVDVAYNGQECLNKIKDNEYDIIFMDIIMPIMDGLTTTKIIRQNFQCKQPIIIALTANTSEEDILKTKQSGMNEFLSKPIDFTKLQELLKKYM